MVQTPNNTGAQITGKPWVSYILIAMNVAVFVLQMTSPALGDSLALRPSDVAGGDFYRLFTSAFTHYEIPHLLFNMWALYVLGPPLEQRMGRWRFISLYALSALGGSVAIYLLSTPGVPTIGASGAVFGLFGATFVMAKRLNLDVRMIVVLIVVNLGFTFTVPGISWQGHLGGLITGALVAVAFVYAPRAQRNAVQAGAVIGLAAVFVALIAWRTTTLVDQFGPMLTHR